jgi:hypothetical protein
MKKIIRQLTASTSQPPRTGPTAAVAAPAAAQMPTARPRASPSKVTPSMAKLLGISIAAPMPWMKRAPIKTASPGARPHAAEASPNRTTPKMRSRRCP